MFSYLEFFCKFQRTTNFSNERQHEAKEKFAVGMEDQEPLLSETTIERTESEEERTQTEINDPPPLPNNDTSEMQGRYN